MNSVSTIVVYCVIALGTFAVLITALAFLLLRRMAQGIKERELHSKQIRETAIQTQEIERSVLADNLHDDFGPQLSFLYRQLRPDIDANDPIYISSEERVNIYKRINELIADVRKYSSQIYPTNFKESGLINAIEQNLTDLGFNIRINFFNRLIYDLNFPQPKQLAIYRITNEILNNIIRHGKPTFIECELNNDEDKFQVVFTHDGAPFSQKEFLETARINEGRGCSSILNRTLQLEGTIEFYRILDQYACTKLQLPLK
jgi:signal transduction histidine kinase